MSESPDPAGPGTALDAVAAARAEAEAQRLADADLAGELMVTLSQFRRGELMVEVAKKLRDLVKAVRTHKKGGQLVLTIKVKPVSKNTVSTLELTDSVQVKAPTGERESVTMFSSKEGGLSLDHPDQLAMRIERDTTPGGTR